MHRSDEQDEGCRQTVGPTWRSHGTPVRNLYLILVTFFLIITIVGILGYESHPHPPNDFFAFNSFSRFIHHYPPRLIYDQQLLRTFQDLPHQKLFAFMYHPGMLLLVWPLADLPFELGYVFWIGIGLVVYVIAVSDRSRPIALLAAVAPSTLWTVLCGQSSLLVAGLLIGGLRLTRSHPMLAGLLLGLATYKPQLGILVPVALVAAGQWRTIASAVTTLLGIVLITTLAFGLPIWPTWFYHLPSIIHVSTSNAISWAPLLATVTSNLMMLGIGARVANIVQLAAACAAIICVWRCFRRGGCGELEIAALAAATFIATPFAFTYDMPLLTASVLLFVNERYRTGETFVFREIMSVVATLLLPYWVLTEWLHAGTSLVVLILLWSVVHRIAGLRRDNDMRTTCQAAAATMA